MRPKHRGAKEGGSSPCQPQGYSYPVSADLRLIWSKFETESLVQVDSEVPGGAADRYVFSWEGVAT